MIHSRSYGLFSGLWVCRVGLLSLVFGVCFAGCATPEPSRLPPETPSSVLTGNTPKQAAAPLGEFNLNKRHGLGGWDQQGGPSEQELLQKMAEPSSEAASSAVVKSTAQPVSGRGAP